MKLGRLLAVLGVLLVLGIISFHIYVQVRTYPADSEYLDAIMADRDIVVDEERDCFTITPKAVNPATPPIIFYPGGLVAPDAYLYKMGHVAARLQTVVYVIKARFNAAIFDVGAAGRIIDRHSLERPWVGGHSLGGIAASRFASSNADRVYGLFMFGSYSDRDISDFKGPVVSVMGLRDLVITRGNYESAKSGLPSTALIDELEGLNHSDFGNYGPQKGDGQSNLSDEQVIDIIVSVFKR